MTIRHSSYYDPNYHTDDQTAHNWKKASISYANGGCIEVSSGSVDLVRVRDSKNPGGTVLGFSPAGWNAFVGAIRNGTYDR